MPHDFYQQYHLLSVYLDRLWVLRAKLRWHQSHCRGYISSHWNFVQSKRGIHEFYYISPITISRFWWIKLLIKIARARHSACDFDINIRIMYESLPLLRKMCNIWRAILNKITIFKSTSYNVELTHPGWVMNISDSKLHYHRKEYRWNSNQNITHFMHENESVIVGYKFKFTTNVCGAGY